jgi:hypothetical protein
MSERKSNTAIIHSGENGFIIRATKDNNRTAFKGRRTYTLNRIDKKKLAITQAKGMAAAHKTTKGKRKIKR